MGFRPGPEHPRSGPHLPRGIEQHGIDESLGDDAPGAVVRCLTCGKGKPPLITGSFIPDYGQEYAGRRFRYRLCPSCLSYANGPLDPDPRYVEGDPEKAA